MTTPKLYDINETAEKVRLSPSWLYRHAGKTIPVTRPGGSKRLMWTDEQIEQIIRDGAQPAKVKARTSTQGQRSTAPTKKAPELKAAPAPVAYIPQARPERSRKYRPAVHS